MHCHHTVQAAPPFAVADVLPTICNAVTKNLSAPPPSPLKQTDERYRRVESTDRRQKPCRTPARYDPLAVPDELEAEQGFARVGRSDLGVPDLAKVLLGRRVGNATTLRQGTTRKCSVRRGAGVSCIETRSSA